MPVHPPHFPAETRFSAPLQDASSNSDQGIASLSCPRCGGHGLKQIHRRPVDRFMSNFVRLRRFECRERRCYWVGNFTERAGLPVSPSAMPTPISISRAKAILTSAVLVIIAVVARLLQW